MGRCVIGAGKAEDLRDMALPSTAPTLAEQVDELGSIGEQIEGVTQRLAKSKLGQQLVALRKQESDLFEAVAAAALDGLAADDKAKIEGGEFVAEWGQCANKTEVSAPGKLVEYLKQLGEREFLQLVRFSITELRDYLPGPMFKKVTKTERVGGRRFKLSRIGS